MYSWLRSVCEAAFVARLVCDVAVVAYKHNKVRLRIALPIPTLPTPHPPIRPPTHSNPRHPLPRPHSHSNPQRLNSVTGGQQPGGAE